MRPAFMLYVLGHSSDRSPVSFCLGEVLLNTVLENNRYQTVVTFQKVTFVYNPKMDQEYDT